LNKPPRFDDRPDFLGLGGFCVGDDLAPQSYECCFFLPASELAKIWVLIRRKSATDNIIIGSWKFSCELKTGDDVLLAKEIFHTGYTERDWGSGAEVTLIGEVTRLTVDSGDVSQIDIREARFSISNSAMLRSADIIRHSGGEIVSRKVVRNGPTCSVTPTIAFSFGSTYKLGPTGNVNSAVECTLLDPSQFLNSTQAIASLEDVLTLASFVERRTLAWTGWRISYANGATSRYYRRDFPTPDTEPVDIDGTLIKLTDIGEFLNSGLVKFGELSRPGALRQAIEFSLFGEDRMIGSSFVMLFAGIETLLKLFKSKDEPSKRDWGSFSDRISLLLGSDGRFSSLPAAIQDNVRGNIRDANRAPFAKKFDHMCSTQNLELSDLWPMTDPVGASLYSIRNQIMHGRVFPGNEDWFRIVSAKYHLLWTLERIILSLLGWPLNRSRVSAGSLGKMTLYKTWRADRENFKTA